MTHAITRHAAQTPARDLILAALREARTRRDQANEDIRVLLAYARELTQPRPYRLADLAEAAGMSISGVRCAYTQCHIERARQLTEPAHTTGTLTDITAALAAGSTR